MKQLKEKFKQYRSQPFFFCLLLSLALVPSLFYMLYFFTRMDTLESVQQQIAQLSKKADLQKFRKEEEELFLKKLKMADHYYIDKQLESQLFLESELKRYQAVLAYDPEECWTKKRVQFLKEGTNRLRFSEQNLKNIHGFQEVEEVQQHTVEMNLEDLKQLLAHIEDVTIGPYLPHPNSPQLIIKNFELTKKKLKENEEVYLVNLQLIKRELSQ